MSRDAESVTSLPLPGRRFIISKAPIRAGRARHPIEGGRIQPAGSPAESVLKMTDLKCLS